MKVVILAGGYGTRLSEETSLKPKPMVEIGEEPILWHIMKIYSHFGYNDFIICLGYKGNIIKDYFIKYHWMHSNLTADLNSGSIIPSLSIRIKPNLPSGFTAVIVTSLSCFLWKATRSFTLTSETPSPYVIRNVLSSRYFSIRLKRPPVITSVPVSIS